MRIFRATGKVRGEVKHSDGTVQYLFAGQEYKTNKSVVDVFGVIEVEVPKKKVSKKAKTHADDNENEITQE